MLSRKFLSLTKLKGMNRNPLAITLQSGQIPLTNRLPWTPTTFEKAGSAWSFPVSLFPFPASRSAPNLFKLVRSFHSNSRLTYWHARLMRGGWLAFLFPHLVTYCIDTSTHIYTHRYICTHIYTQIYMYTYIHTDIYVHIYTHRYICTHIYTQIHMYTYIHIYIHALKTTV